MVFFHMVYTTCDCCHTALQHGPHQIYGLGHVHGFSYCLPRVALPQLLLSPMVLALLYMYNVIHCVHVYFTNFFVSYPHSMALIASVLLRRVARKKISASNAYTCTILPCYHAPYSILLLMCMYIAIAFTCI